MFLFSVNHFLLGFLIWFRSCHSTHSPDDLCDPIPPPPLPSVRINYSVLPVFTYPSYVIQYSQRCHLRIALSGYSVGATEDCRVFGVPTKNWNYSIVTVNAIQLNLSFGDEKISYDLTQNLLNFLQFLFFLQTRKARKAFHTRKTVFHDKFQSSYCFVFKKWLA